MNDTEMLDWLQTHLTRHVTNLGCKTASLSLRVKKHDDGTLDFSIGGGLHGDSLRDAIQENAQRKDRP